MVSKFPSAKPGHLPPGITAGVDFDFFPHPFVLRVSFQKINDFTITDGSKRGQRWRVSFIQNIFYFLNQPGGDHIVHPLINPQMEFVAVSAKRDEDGFFRKAIRPVAVKRAKGFARLHPYVKSPVDPVFVVTIHSAGIFRVNFFQPLIKRFDSGFFINLLQFFDIIGISGRDGVKRP